MDSGVHGGKTSCNEGLVEQNTLAYWAPLGLGGKTTGQPRQWTRSYGTETQWLFTKGLLGTWRKRPHAMGWQRKYKAYQASLCLGGTKPQDRPISIQSHVGLQAQWLQKFFLGKGDRNSFLQIFYEYMVTQGYSYTVGSSDPLMMLLTQNKQCMNPGKHWAQEGLIFPNVAIRWWCYNHGAT